MSHDVCPCSGTCAKVLEEVRALREEVRKAIGADLLTVDEAARMMKVTPAAMRQQIHRGKVKAVHVMGNRVRIRREDLPVR